MRCHTEYVGGPLRVAAFASARGLRVAGWFLLVTGSLTWPVVRLSFCCGCCLCTLGTSRAMGDVGRRGSATGGCCFRRWARKRDTSSARSARIATCSRSTAAWRRARSRSLFAKSVVCSSFLWGSRRCAWPSGCTGRRTCCVAASAGLARLVGCSRAAAA